MNAEVFPDLLVVMALEVESQDRFARAGIPVLYTGVGKINASIGLMRRLQAYRAAGRELPLVLNLGTAGSKRFARGALVACHGFVQLDMDVSALGFPAGQTPFDTVPARLEFPVLLTGLEPAVCGSADRFETGVPALPCDVIDMEAYALAKVCHVEGARFACAKYVTDGADETAAVEWQDSLAAAADAFWRLYASLGASMSASPGATPGASAP
jgi:adenosylhomocysteine nucleosidase